MLDELTPRQAEVLGMLAEGLTTREIAEKLNLGYGTVSKHRQRIYKRLGVHSGAEAVARFLQAPSPDRQHIDRFIEFSSEHFQAGVDILSYFGTVLRQKHPGTGATVRIEQQGLAVRLVIESSGEEEKEIIEKTLQKYGLVVTGELPAEQLFTDQAHILQLENRLELSRMEIRLAYKQLDFERESYENRVDALEQEVKWLRGTIGSSLSIGSSVSSSFVTLGDLIHELGSQRDAALDSALLVLDQLLKQENVNKLEALEALETIRKREPGLFERLKDFAFNTASSTTASFLKELLSSLVS